MTPTAGFGSWGQAYVACAMSPITGLNGFKKRMKVAEELGIEKISLLLIFPSADMLMVSHLHSVCNIKEGEFPQLCWGGYVRP